MFKLLVIALAYISFTEAAITNLQLIVPDDNTNAILGNGKIGAIAPRGSISLSNAISDEENSSIADEEPEDVQASLDSDLAAAAEVASAAAEPISAPAATTRLRPSNTLSAISSLGLTRPSVVISSANLAQASSSSALGTGSGSARSSSTTIQHRILPAESIPLPITISTRPGLRTVIAPETITIHQPTIAKIGEVVQQIPTAVSHQRQTVVHNHARVVTPIVAPAVRTVTSQILRAYHTPLVYAPQQPTIQVVNN